MSAGWYVACEQTGRHELPHQGKALLFAQFHLEEFARALQVPSLKEFLSINPSAMLNYLQEQGIEPDPDNLPEENWFEPNTAQATLTTLLQQLDTDPGLVQSLDKVRADLQAILAVVTEADRNGERFHIAAALPDLSGREPEPRQRHP